MELVFDGRDDAGQVLAEGAYVGKLAVLYVNGNNPKADSPASGGRPDRPDGLHQRGPGHLLPRRGREQGHGEHLPGDPARSSSGRAAIENVDGQPVRTFSWRGAAEARIQWDGRSDAGKLAPDGTYLYSLKATDRAGNSGESRRLSIQLNTEATEVFLAADADVFSPNADGVKDTLTVRPRLKVTEGVASYTLRILDKAGQAVRSLQAQNRAPQDFAWDGLDNRGRRVPDGEYTAELALEYQKGDRHLVKTGAFSVDTQAPTIEASAEYGLFSPDGDGNRDFLPVTQTSSSEELWEGAFLNAKGETVRRYYWKGQAASLRWDGKDENGNKIPDGQYLYRVKGTDRAGNARHPRNPRHHPGHPPDRGLPDGVRGRLLAQRGQARRQPGLQPGGDPGRGHPDLDPADGARGGRGAEDLQRPAPGAAAPVLGRQGRLRCSRRAKAAYQAVFRADYAKGNRPQAQSAPFLLDLTAPQVEMSFAPQPFSPDNDGVEDELAIGLKVQDLSPVTDWAIRIDDPEAHPFVSFAGKGLPSERIIWNGLSDSGELVQAASDYTFNFTIRDQLGNARTVQKLIAVDVLVIRDGDKLKIRIPSITFPPNSPDLSKVVEADKAAKNDWVLQRLAQILEQVQLLQLPHRGPRQPGVLAGRGAGRARGEGGAGAPVPGPGRGGEERPGAAGTEGGPDFRGRPGRHQPARALRRPGEPLEEPQGGVHPAEEVGGGARARTMARRSGRGADRRRRCAVVVLAVGLAAIALRARTPLRRVFRRRGGSSPCARGKAWGASRRGSRRRGWCAPPSSCRPWRA